MTDALSSLALGDCGARSQSRAEAAVVLCSTVAIACENPMTTAREDKRSARFDAVVRTVSQTGP